MFLIHVTSSSHPKVRHSPLWRVLAIAIVAPMVSLQRLGIASPIDSRFGLWHRNDSDRVIRREIPDESVLFSREETASLLPRHRQFAVRLKGSTTPDAANDDGSDESQFSVGEWFIGK